MKTSKPMQLRILDKMRENVEGGNGLLKDIQYKNMSTNGWDGGIYDVSDRHFEKLEMRVKPETITINGVEIPKPLGGDEILGDEVYYHVDNSEFLYEARHGEFIADHGIRFVYSTKQEAIKASKLLFGIED